MAVGLAIVPDLPPEVEEALAGAFDHGALPCRYNDEMPRRAFSSVAWILADEIPFPQRLRVTLGDLQDSGFVDVLQAVLCCIDRMKREIASWNRTQGEIRNAAKRVGRDDTTGPSWIPDSDIVHISAVSGPCCQ